MAKLEISISDGRGRLDGILPPTPQKKKSIKKREKKMLAVKIHTANFRYVSPVQVYRAAQSSKRSGRNFWDVNAEIIFFSEICL